MPQRKNEAKWIEKAERWQINVQMDGQRKTFVSSIPGKKGKIEAEKKADKWLAGEMLEDPRFYEAWKLYLEEKKATTSRSNWQKLDTLGRNWVLPPLKHKRLSAIKIQHMQNCITEAAKAGRSKSTCKGVREVITSFGRFARKNRWAMENPEFLVIPTYAPTGKRKVLDETAIQLLFSEDSVVERGRVVVSPYIHAWRFEVVTGLRRGEVAGIMHSDIQHDVLSIQRAINKYAEITPGKNENAQRRIFLPEVAKAILRSQAQMLEEKGIVSSFVFPAPDGSSIIPATMSKAWKRYGEQHKIACTLHELRHTFVSLMKSDLPEALLKSVVGHSANMDSIGIYGHTVNGDMQRAAAVIDRVFGEILK